MKHRYYAPLFDEYANEELEGFLEDDCVFEIKDQFEDLPIFVDSPNEEFGGDFEGGTVFDKFSKENIGYNDVSTFDELSHEDVPIYDKV